MLIKAGFNVEIELSEPSYVVTLLDVHSTFEASVVNKVPFTASPSVPCETTRDTAGNVVRRFKAPAGLTSLSQTVTLSVSETFELQIGGAIDTPVGKIPLECLPYLSGSRYCETDLISPFAWSRFGALPAGGQRVKAIFDFVHSHVRFDYNCASATRTALGTLNDQVGVCRDFAHLAIALCRAVNVPARYINGYLGDIRVPAVPSPMDFSAWCEVYVGGRWMTLDARHNVPRVGRIVIAKGRDAADVAMITSFGAHRLSRFVVTAEEVREEAVDRLRTPRSASA